MENLLSDIRYSLRQFRETPVFTLTAILTLALGIGGTTAIFSLIHTVMLRSLPVADPASLYRIGEGSDCCVEGGPQDQWGLFSFALYERIRAATPEFEQIAAFQAAPNRFGVRRESVDRDARPVSGEFVSGNYFSVFGIRPFSGRLLSPSDDQASARPVATLSYHAWTQTYGSDPNVIGSTFVIDGHPFTIVGITPPGFFGETLRSDPADLWLPIQQEPMMDVQGALLRQPTEAWLRLIGRLRPGATVAGVGPRLTVLLRHWLQYEAGFPAAWIADIIKLLPKQQIRVIPAGAGVAEMEEDYGRSLEILLAVCALVLLIACANVANLMLARGMARRAQTSLRMAIGASRARILAQSLTESVLLSVAGGIAGLFVADAAGQLVLTLAFHSAHFVPISTSPSLPLLGFAFALSVLTGALFGTAPAWFATRTDPVEALRGANRSTRDSASFSRKALLTMQATLSVVLVAGAGMLTRSLNHLENQDFGFQTANRISISLNPPPASYEPLRLAALYRDLEDRLRRLPGVEHVSLSLYNPFTSNWGENIVIEGRSSTGLSENTNASWDRVSTDYFPSVGQAVIRGRAFEKADANGSPVAVVNEAFVRRFFPNEDPMDKRFGMDLPENAGTFRIIGVARDAKYYSLRKPPRPMFFASLDQYQNYSNELIRQVELRSHYIGSSMIQTRADLGTMEAVLRKTFAEADPNLTVLNVRTMQQELDLNFDQERSVAGLATLFGLVALALAAVGLYGVTAYTVAQRTSEIGVRMALGADKREVIGLVLRGAFQRVAVGLLLGIPLAIGAGRLMAAQLYQVGSWDPVSLAIAIGALAACAFVAAIVPAARAAALDPTTALRVE
jgi:predicted permease